MRPSMLLLMLDDSHSFDRGGGNVNYVLPLVPDFFPKLFLSDLSTTSVMSTTQVQQDSCDKALLSFILAWGLTMPDEGVKNDRRTMWSSFVRLRLSACSEQ